MPIFEFYCGKCEHVTEKLVMKKTEEKYIICEKCKSTNIEKIMSRGRFELKGCGWSGDGTTDPDSDQYLIDRGPNRAIHALQKKVK